MSATICWISYFYKPVILVMSYSHQLLLSGTFISYSYLLYSDTLKAQQIQRCFFYIKKTPFQVAWNTNYFRPVLKDFSRLKQDVFKSSLRLFYWDVNMIKKRPLNRSWHVFRAVFQIKSYWKGRLKVVKQMMNATSLLKTPKDVFKSSLRGLSYITH